MVSSLVLGTTVAHSLSSSRSRSISGTGISSRSLRVSAWEWERMAAIRTHSPSTGMVASPERPRILLVSAWAFHSSRDWPLPRSASIQGMSEPARGTPNWVVSSSPPRWAASTARSISRIADAGSDSCSATVPLRSPNCRSTSRMWRAPPPEAAW